VSLDEFGQTALSEITSVGALLASLALVAALAMPFVFS
jgi:hypothetical protein